MKKNKIIIFLIFLFLNIVTFTASFTIPGLYIEGVLKKDGSMTVAEILTYDIEEINGVLFDIDAKGYGKISSIEVYEDDGVKEGEYKYKKVDSSNYEITVDDELYKIKLYSKNRNNIRKFAFVYTLPDAVKVYDDVAQFNRKMVGQNWEKSIENIFVNIKVPVGENYDNTKILAFGHGSLTGDVEKYKNEVYYILKNYYPQDFVEAHILMETNIFSDIDKSKIIHENKKEELLEMEKKLAEEANLKREEALKREEFLKSLQKYSNPLFILEMVFCIAAMCYVHIVLKRKKKKDAYKDKYGKYFREVPEKYSPSLVGTIITGAPDDQEIFATLLNLIRRKIIILDEAPNKNKLTFKIGEENLSREERIIVDIYFNEFGNGESVILENIKGKVISRVARKFEKWREEVLSELESKNLTYSTFEVISISLRIRFIIIIIALYVVASLQIAYLDHELSILLLLMTTVLLLSLYKIKVPKDELLEVKAKLEAFKNFLVDYSQLDDGSIASIRLWEHYFVYAVAMGVSDKVVKAYRKALDMGQIEGFGATEVITGLSLMELHSRKSFYNGLSKTTKTVYKRSMADITKSRMSSSSGGGGGFSSGSSGGGGSRGGGGGF